MGHYDVHSSYNVDFMTHGVSTRFEGCIHTVGTFGRHYERCMGILVIY